MNRYRKDKEKFNRKKLAGLVAGGLVFVVIIVAAVFFIKDAIYYKGLHKQINVELGEDLPEAEDFAKEGNVTYITDISVIDKKKVGKYPVKIDYNGEEKEVYIVIEDTTAPVVAAKDMEISVYEEYEAYELIDSIEDYSKVKIEYKEKPEYGKAGEYDAVISVEDEYGNETITTVEIDILRVKEFVEYQIGDTYPDVSEFIYSDRDIGEYVTDLKTIPKKRGTYYVTIKIDGQKYTSQMIVVDERKPLVAGRDVDMSFDEVAAGITVKPENFVRKCSDDDDVEMYFINNPDYTLEGVQEVSVAVTDGSGNTTIITRNLYIEETKGMEVSIGSEKTVEEIIASNTGGSEVVILQGLFDINTLGRYNLSVSIDGVVKDINIRVADVEVPKADGIDVVLDKKQELTADMFVKNVVDSTSVTMELESEIDETVRGKRDITVILTDEGENVSYVYATLDIQYDAVPPQISGITEVSTYIRQNPDYLFGVEAIDDIDGEVKVTVDDSKVNLETPGLYEIMYIAKDKSGNVAKVPSVLEVKNVDRALIDSMVDDILSEITDDKMTTAQKAMAAYDYIQANVRYINQSDQSSVEKAAYNGLTVGQGDCYTFASLVKIFMERLGAKTEFVKRDNPNSNHYWYLVNFGDGWYHMDATPLASGYKCFMKTDAELNAQSATYWIYDSSKYPKVSKKSFEMK